MTPHPLPHPETVDDVIARCAPVIEAECYYIGVLRTVDNFGQHASHKKT